LPEQEYDTICPGARTLSRSGNLGYWVGWTEDIEPLTIRDLTSRLICHIDRSLARGMREAGRRKQCV
jgi:hypothetical protein